MPSLHRIRNRQVSGSSPLVGSSLISFRDRSAFSFVTSCRSLGRFCRRRWELNHSALLLQGMPLRRFREFRRYVELNYFCHGLFLQLIGPFAQSPAHPFRVCANGQATPIRTGSGWNRSTSVSSEALYTVHMTSSTFFLPLFFLCRLDSPIGSSDATRLSFDCHECVAISPREVTHRVLFPKKSAMSASYATQSWCQCGHDRFILTRYLVVL